MRLRIGRDALAEAVAWVARALPARPVIPILAGLLLDTRDAGGLMLSCFDYDVSARVGADATVTEPGRVLVAGRLLAEIARSLPPHPVDLVSDGDTVIVSCGSTRFTLLGLPVEDFPALPTLPPSAGTVDGGSFATAVGQVAVAAGRDDTLPMLTGILIEVDGRGMTLVATDRYRMAVRELEWHPADPALRASALVPARTLADAAKTMIAGTEVEISLSGAGDEHTAGSAAGLAGRGDGANGLIGFEGGGRRLTTRLLGAEFVSYRSRFPREFGCRARLSAGPLTEAIRRVALVADRESRLLLTFGPGDVVIETGSGEGSRAVETVEADFEGEEGFTIAFKPNYLLDGIGAAATGGGARTGAQPQAGEHPQAGEQASAQSQDSGQASGESHGGTVTLEFTTPDKPAVITGSPGFRYLLAPMRA
jgi:DNA polymerase III subunit beta